MRQYAQYRRQLTLSTMLVLPALVALAPGALAQCASSAGTVSVPANGATVTCYANQTSTTQIGDGTTSATVNLQDNHFLNLSAGGNGVYLQGGTVTLGAGARIDSGSTGSNAGIVTNGAGNITLGTGAQVNGYQHGIASYSGNSTITLGNDAQVDATKIGIYAPGNPLITLGAGAQINAGIDGIDGTFAFAPGSKKVALTLGSNAKIAAGSIGVHAKYADISMQTGAQISGSGSGVYLGFSGGPSVITLAPGASIVSTGGNAINDPHGKMTLTNGGLLSAPGAPALSIFGSGNAIVNSGTITGKTGISLGGSGILSSSIRNQAGGVIRGTGGAAIRLHSTSDVAGGITNAAGGTFSGGADGIQVSLNSNISGGVANDGIISVAAAGIHVISSSAISGGIANSGTISGGNDGILVDATSRIGGIRSTGAISGAGGAIVNQGTISGATTAISIGSGGVISGGIANSGTISGGAAGIVNGGKITGSVTDTGVIKSIVNTGTIAGTTGIRVTGAAIAGGITTSGTIDGTGGTAISFTGLSAATPLDILGGSIKGDVTDSSPASGFSPVTFGGSFTTSGNFDVSSVSVAGAKTLTISPGNTVTTFSTPAGAGTYTFGLSSLANAGFLKVTNGSVGLPASQIAARVTGGGSLGAGDILIATGAAPDTVAPTQIADNSILWNFAVEDGGQTGLSTPNDLWLVVTSNAAAVVAPGSGNSNALKTLLALTPAQLSGSGGQLQTILNNVNQAGTTAQLAAALGAAQPDMSGGAFYGVQNFVDAVQDVTDEYLRPRRETAAGKAGAAAGNAMAGMRAWGQFFGQTARQGARDGIGGFNANTGGFAMGMDGEGGGDGRFGFGIAYGHTGVGANDPSSSDTSIDSYQISLYGSLVDDGDDFARGFVSYVRNADDTVRHNAGGTGLDARGSYGANELAALVKAGRYWRTDGALTLSPVAMARWVYYSPQSYTESGAGAADLHVQQRDMSMFQLGLGGEAQWDILRPDGSYVVPSLKGGYSYDLVGDRFEATSAFTGGGGAFASPGPNPARGQFDLGAGVAWYTTGAWQFKANYDLTYKTGYTAHSALLRATISY